MENDNLSAYIIEGNLEKTMEAFNNGERLSHSTVCEFAVISGKTKIAKAFYDLEPQDSKSLLLHAAACINDNASLIEWLCDKDATLDDWLIHSMATTLENYRIADFIKNEIIVSHNKNTIDNEYGKILKQFEEE